MTGNIDDYSFIIHNESYFTGGCYKVDAKDCIDSILHFNPNDGSWNNVGQMKYPRGVHGASLVNVVDIIDYCN